MQLVNEPRCLCSLLYLSIPHHKTIQNLNKNSNLPLRFKNSQSKNEKLITISIKDISTMMMLFFFCIAFFYPNYQIFSIYFHIIHALKHCTFPTKFFLLSVFTTVPVVRGCRRTHTHNKCFTILFFSSLCWFFFFHSFNTVHLRVHIRSKKKLRFRFNLSFH